MANPVLALNENFSYNSMLARALMQLIPARDKGSLHAWLHVLHQMDDSVEVMTIRNEYMWLLLTQLQSKRITEPFSHPPQSRHLPPLRDVLPPHIYDEVLVASEKSMSWLSQSPDGEEEHIGGKSAIASKKYHAPPERFIKCQPMPLNGVICHLAAFSNQSFN